MCRTSTRSDQVMFLAALRARQRGVRIIETGDLLTALVVEDQGGYANAVSVIPPAPRVNHRHQSRKSYSISYLLSFGGLLKRRGPAPGPKEPFLPPGTADIILARLAGCLPRGQPLSWEANVGGSGGADRVYRAAYAMACGSRRELTEPWRMLLAAMCDRLLNRKQVRPLHLLAAALEDESDPCVQIFLGAGITREKVLEALSAGRS